MSRQRRKLTEPVRWAVYGDDAVLVGHVERNTVKPEDPRRFMVVWPRDLDEVRDATLYTTIWAAARAIRLRAHKARP